MNAPRMTATRVRNHVRDLIASGGYAPGDRLPTERELAETLGASRNVVRDGLMMLESRGAVRRVVGSGTYVEAFEEPASAPGWKPRHSTPAEIMEARLAFEPRLARIAAMHATEDEVARMEAIDAQSRHHLKGDGFEPLDAALHALIASATRNHLLQHLYAEVNAARDQALWGELKRRSGTPENRAIYVDEHLAIIDAIRRRDAEQAEDAARMHLRSVRQHLLGE